jgi:predicted Zn-dependent protease
MNKFISAGVTIVISGLCLITFTVCAQSLNKDKNTLPEIGVVASDTLTLDKEMIIGDALMRQMRGGAPVINDPVLTEYIQDLGNRLVVNADNTKFPFSFFWVNNNSINAFAFYGGHVGVNTGLIESADTESELASVLAHEISHVTQRHIARRAQATQRSSPLAMASLLGSILLAIANPEAGMAALSTTQAVSSQMQIDYTRSNEQEADRIGIAMLANSGFDPRASATFFGKMAEQYRLVSLPPARLLSHPLTESRIADARSRAANYPVPNLKPSLPFHLAKARVMARYAFEPEFAVAYFKNQNNSKNAVELAARNYGLAIALFENKQFKEAHNLIVELLKQQPENLFYLDVATDIALAANQPKKAIAMLAANLERTPNNEVLVLNMANALIQDKQYKAATTLLRDYLLVHKDDEIAYQLLVTANEKEKNFLEMHQYKAELMALYGAYPKAIDQLQYAYNFAGDDHLSKQRIRARIQQFREQVDKLERL